MNSGPDNYGSGTSKTDDRFSGQLGGYRPGRRDGELSTDTLSLAPRNGSSLDRVSSPLDPAPIAASIAQPKLADPTLGDLGPLSEPMFGRDAEPMFGRDPEPIFGRDAEPIFGRDAWLDAPSGSLADHPLLRGLLLELPPKGTLPQQDWLDRWFEAARSILELIYSQEARTRG